MEITINKSIVHKAAKAATFAKSFSLFDCPDESFDADTHATMKAKNTKSCIQIKHNIIIIEMLLHKTNCENEDRFID